MLPVGRKLKMEIPGQSGVVSTEVPAQDEGDRGSVRRDGGADCGSSPRLRGESERIAPLEASFPRSARERISRRVQAQRRIGQSGSAHSQAGSIYVGRCILGGSCHGLE